MYSNYCGRNKSAVKNHIRVVSNYIAPEYQMPWSLHETNVLDSPSFSVFKTIRRYTLREGCVDSKREIERERDGISDRVQGRKSHKTLSRCIPCSKALSARWQWEKRKRARAREWERRRSSPRSMRRRAGADRPYHSQLTNSESPVELMVLLGWLRGFQSQHPIYMGHIYEKKRELKGVTGPEDRVDISRNAYSAFFLCRFPPFCSSPNGFSGECKRAMPPRATVPRD